MSGEQTARDGDDRHISPYGRGACATEQVKCTVILVEQRLNSD